MKMLENVFVFNLTTSITRLMVYLTKGFLNNYHITYNVLLITYTYHRYKESGSEQLTHAMHVKDRYVNGTFIHKLTKWYQ